MFHFKQITKIIISGLVFLASSIAFAQQETLDDVVVTATRTPEPVKDTLSSVTVVDRADIERMQAQNLPDALRGIAGLDIANSGGPGQLTSFFLRGTESNHVLVLVDGVKVGSATTGLTQFENIPIDQVERIEVVRGPRASIYGSEAIGGVIQIFTRKGKRELKHYFNVGGSAGDIESLKGSAGISGGNEQGWISLNISGLNSSGIDSCISPVGLGCTAFSPVEPDRDGSHYGSGSLRTGYKLGERADLELHFLHTEGFTEFDGGFQNETDYSNTVIGGKLRLQPHDRWQMIMSVGQSQDKTENMLDGVFASQFDTKRSSASVQNNITLAEQHLLTLGLDFQVDEVDSSTNFLVDSRENLGLYSQYQGSFGRFDVQGSVRYDDNEQFGSHTTGSAAAGFTLTSSLRLMASYGTAFVAPTFNDLYFPFGAGNPDLQPETSESFELGLRGQHGWGNWTLSAYQTDIENLIGLDATFFPINILESRIRGFEANASTRLYGFDLNTALTLLDPENRSAGPNRGNDLPRRANQQLRVDIDRTIGKFSAGTTLHAASSRYDDLANTLEMGGYVTMDLRGEYRFHRDWRVQARLANLLDKDYETVRFFNQPGRTVFFTLSYQPQDL